MTARQTLHFPTPDPRLAFLAALVFAACALIVGAPSDAQAQEDDIKAAYEVEGAIGLGYTTGNAPLGIRMWFSSQFGFDANLGLVLNGEEPDIESTDPDDTTTTMDFAIDGGFLIALWKTDNSILWIRPGLNFDRRYADGFNDSGEPVYSSNDTLGLTALAGFEFFLTKLGLPNLSLQGGVGVSFNYVIPAQQGGAEESDWSLGSLATDVSIVETAQLGFHYYFF